MTDIPQEVKALSFEQAFGKLEETTRKLEAGNLSLEESLALYQQGITLAQHCGNQLDQAELSIKSLTPSGDLIEFDDI